MNEVSVTPCIGLMCEVDLAIYEKNWLLAMKHAYDIIMEADPVTEHILLKRACRIFVEINMSLAKGDNMKQDYSLVQMLGERDYFCCCQSLSRFLSRFFITIFLSPVFSHVKPVNWPGTVGIAAEMHQQKSSRIGDVVLGDNGIPMLVGGDNWCAACNKEETIGKCNKCNEAYYCSEQHQQTHWPVHKFECLRKRNDDAWENCDIYKRGMERAKAAAKKLMEVIYE